MNKRWEKNGDDEYHVKFKPREIWTRLVPAASLVLALAGFSARTIISDVHDVVVDAPVKEHRLDELEQRATALESTVQEIHETLILLNATQERLVTSLDKLGDNQEE